MSVLITGLTREGNKSFLITSLVDYVFPHSNLPNSMLSPDFFVNDTAPLLLFCRMCHVAERHGCPSKSLSCLSDHAQHFVEKDDRHSSAIWTIAVVEYCWLQFFQGEKKWTKWMLGAVSLTN